MRCREIRRWIASVFAVLFIAVFAMGTVQEAEAAAATKAYYVPTKATIKMTYSEGYSNTQTLSFSYYTGDRAGLLKQYSSGGGKTVFSRTGAGLLNTMKQYYSGQLEMRGKTTINKGKVKRYRTYYVNPDGTEKLYQTYAFTYSGNRRTKMTMTYNNGPKITTTYRSNGTRSKMTTTYNGTSQTVTFNAKGDLTRVVMMSKDPSNAGNYYKQTLTYKYTYNKKGDPTKVTGKMVREQSIDGKVEKHSQSMTLTNKFTYKNGNITKCVQKTSSGSGEHTYESTYTYTIRYKKVKVKQKYWSMLDGKVPYVPGYFDSVKELIRMIYLPMGSMGGGPGGAVPVIVGP